jgi:hypothetical protein
MLLAHVCNTHGFREQGDLANAHGRTCFRHLRQDQQRWERLLHLGPLYPPRLHGPHECLQEGGLELRGLRDPGYIRRTSGRQMSTALTSICAGPFSIPMCRGERRLEEIPDAADAEQWRRRVYTFLGAEVQRREEEKQRRKEDRLYGLLHARRL